MRSGTDRRRARGSMCGETIPPTGGEYVEAFSCSDENPEPRYDRAIQTRRSMARSGDPQFAQLKHARKSNRRFQANKANFVLSENRTTECRRLVRGAIASTLHVRERDGDRLVDVALIDGVCCR
jgi:hypothetical protein